MKKYSILFVLSFLNASPNVKSMHQSIVDNNKTKIQEAVKGLNEHFGTRSDIKVVRINTQNSGKKRKKKDKSIIALEVYELWGISLDTIKKSGFDGYKFKSTINNNSNLWLTATRSCWDELWDRPYNVEIHTVHSGPGNQTVVQTTSYEYSNKYLSKYHNPLSKITPVVVAGTLLTMASVVAYNMMTSQEQ